MCVELPYAAIPFCYPKQELMTFFLLLQNQELDQRQITAVALEEPGLQLPCRFLVRHSHLVILSRVQPLSENPIHFSR